MSDHKFVGFLIKANLERITANFKVVVKALDRLEVPYSPCRGGLFVWADFSKYLSEETFEQEWSLGMAIFDCAGLSIIPGNDFEPRKFGFFRIVHTKMGVKALAVAMERLVTYLSGRPKVVKKPKVEK